MADIAALGFKIDSGEAVTAKSNLDSMTGAAKRAEAASNGLSGANRTHAGAAKMATDAVNGQTAALVRLNAAANQNERHLVGIANNSRNASARIGQLAFQINDIGTMMALGASPFQIIASQGGQIAQIYGGQGGVKAALADVGSILRVTATRFGPIAVAAGLAAAAINEMQDNIEKATGRSVTFGQTLSAALKVIGSDIYSYVGEPLEWMADKIGYAFGKLGSAAVDIAEWTTNAFRAAYADIVFLWEQLPNIVGASVVGAINATTSGISSVVETATGYIDALIDKVNVALTYMNEVTGQGWQIPKIGFEAGDLAIPNDYYEKLKAANEKHRQEVERILGSNPIRDYFKSVGDRAGGLIPDNGTGADPWANMRKEDTAALKRYRDAIREADKAILENRSVFRGFLGDLNEGIRAGESFWEAFANAGIKAMEKLTDRIFDSIAEALFPTSGSAGGALGPLGIFGSLFKGGASAANDNWGGMRGANDNFSAPLGAVTRAPLADIVSYRNAIASIESAGSGGYSAIGPTHATMGRALGRYQVMEANIGPWSKAALGKSVSASDFLGSSSIQDKVFDHRFGGYVDKYGPSGAASMWFTGRPSAPNARDVLGTSGADYVGKFNSSLKNLDASVTGATKNLNTFSNGLGQMGNSLSQFPSAPSGGAGIGALGGMLSSAFSGSKAFNWLTANPGGYVGLYADGTESAPPGWAWVGERGPELMRMRGGETVRSNPRSMQMAAAANGNSAPIMQTIINGAPAGTRERKETGKSADGRDIYRTVIDIVNQGEAEGEFDGVRSSRFGARPKTAARGR